MTIDEPELPDYVRSWNDVGQVVVALAVTLLLQLIGHVAKDGVIGVGKDLTNGIEQIPRPVLEILVIPIQIVSGYLPLVMVVTMLVLRRFRRLATVIVAGLLANRLMLELINRFDETAILNGSGVRAVSRSLTIRPGFPFVWWLAMLTAMIVVETPWLGRAWRRAAYVALGLFGFARLGSNTANSPFNIIMVFTAYAVGWLIGGAMLLAVGRPNRKPRGRDVVTALRRSGIYLTAIRQIPIGAVGARYDATSLEGQPLTIRLWRRDDRAADGAIRLYRFVRFRDVGDEHPLWAPRRRAEYAALAQSVAYGAEVATPRVLTVSPVGLNDDSVLVAYDGVDGRVASDLPDDAFTDDLVDAVWAVAASLRFRRVAHRDLRLAHFVVGEDRSVSVTDFDNAVLGADDHTLARDTAELLSSIAVRVGPERAVGAAIRATGAANVASALPLLQQLALSRVTRAEVHADDDLLARVREEVQARTGAAEIPLEKLERIKPRSVFIILASGLALYAVLPQLLNTSGLWGELRNAEPVWLAAALLASAVSYAGATVALEGSLIDPLPFGGTFGAQLASSFANFVTPAQVGGMALNVRYIQKRGTDAAVAVAAVGLASVTGVVVHLALLGVFGYWAGTAAFDNITIPTNTILIVVGIVVGVGALTLAVPVGRRFVLTNLVPMIGRSIKGISLIARQPAKLLALIGGAVLITTSYIAALACCVYAFGGDVSVAAIAVVFLVGATVASVAPTPGGLGAVEAAMIAGLHGIGISPDIAVSAVLTYRLATFWLPLLPGWAVFTRMQRRGAL